MSISNINNPRYKVQVIDNYDQFEKLRTDWEKLYDLDSQAHIYVSWLWISVYYQHAPEQWLILTAYDEKLNCHAGFLPLTISKAQPTRLKPVTTLTLGAYPNSIFNGIVCNEEDEKEILRALAEFVQREIRWDKFSLSRLINERSEYFITLFDNKKFNIQFLPEWPSLQIPLPDSYETYLKEMLSTSTRKNLRKLERRLNSKSKIALTLATKETIEEDINILISMWEERFGMIKKAPFERKILYRFFEDGKLLLFMYREESRPISVQACILDKSHKTMVGYLIGYNTTYAQYSPGLLVVLQAIKKAIESGMDHFDFLMGGDEYKRSLGGVDRPVKHAMLIRRGLKTKLAIKTEKLTSALKMAFRKL